MKEGQSKKSTLAAGGGRSGPKTPAGGGKSNPVRTKKMATSPSTSYSRKRATEHLRSTGPQIRLTCRRCLSGFRTHKRANGNNPKFCAKCAITRRRQQQNRWQQAHRSTKKT